MILPLLVRMRLQPLGLHTITVMLQLCIQPGLQVHGTLKYCMRYVEHYSNAYHYCKAATLCTARPTSTWSITVMHTITVMFQLYIQPGLQVHALL
jgi:hypothetical protein